MSDLYKKHFLKLLDFTPAQFTSLLTLAAQLKADKKNGKEVQKLTGKNIALIFEKDSTRTRCSFEVAAFDQGARVTWLGPSGSQIGHKESIKDTARVLGRMYDGIQYRGHGQEVVETLAQYAGVPVWNGLTNEFHPTQLLADLLTMQEHLPGKAFNEMTLVYAGDARNNMGNDDGVALFHFQLFRLGHFVTQLEGFHGHFFQRFKVVRREMVFDGVQRVRIATVFQQLFNNQTRLFALLFQ